MMRWLGYFILSIAVLLMGPAYMAAFGSETPEGQSWRTARRSSSGMAPTPEQAKEAIIQVYAARAYSWRGYLAVHTWVATKQKDAENYQIHHVLGWRARRGLPVLASGPDIPDRYWYGNRPDLLIDIRGEQAEALLPKVLEAVRNYPHADEYTMWPGPNSNTFTAYVGREVPELGLQLPVTAIGKDYLPGGALFGSTPSGTGYQFSLLGALGIMVSTEEGIELNLLGLSFGVDFNELAFKFPGIGRIGSLDQK